MLEVRTFRSFIWLCGLSAAGCATPHAVSPSTRPVAADVKVPEATQVAERHLIRKVLEWYKENHPIWFRWLEIA